MNEYNNLQARIRALKLIYFDEDSSLDAINALHEQFNIAGAADWTEEELVNLIKADNNVLDDFDIDKDSALFLSVSGIQDGIISFFSGEYDEK